MFYSRTPSVTVSQVNFTLPENVSGMVGLASRFDAALAAHQAGREVEAEGAYLTILSHDPSHADALHMLGVLRHQQGQSAVAESLIRRALAIRDDTRFWGNLGNVYAEVRRYADAESCYLRAVAQHPDNAIAHLGLGNLLKETNRPGEAEAAYRRALLADPACSQASNNLGILLQDAMRFAEAELAYRQAIAAQPNLPEAHVNLANVLYETRGFADAEASFRHALNIAPEYADGYFNYANLLRGTNRLAEAEASYRKVLSLIPDHADSYANLGLLFNYSNRLLEAKDSFRRAFELGADDPQVHFNHAHLLLQSGDYLRGWQEYEYRWKTKNAEPRPMFRQPQWDGTTSLSGQSILLYAEQGFGDTLQFVRYTRQLAAAGATVYLLVPAVLKSLVASCAGVTAVFDSDDVLPPYDWQYPLMSLPLACRTTLDTIPADVPYLAANPEQVAYWKQRLGNKTGLRVGLVWAGAPRAHLRLSNELDRQRSLHLDQLRALLQVPDVEFFSLQFGEQAVRQLQAYPRIIDLTAEIGDFAGTAALMSNLDLVISVDTAVVHLAGALGKPVWLLNRYNTCWRWLSEREDSPWYPGMRIFRQPALGDWQSVITRVAHALADHIPNR